MVVLNTVSSLAMSAVRPVPTPYTPPRDRALRGTSSPEGRPRPHTEQCLEPRIAYTAWPHQACVTFRVPPQVFKGAHASPATAARQVRYLLRAAAIQVFFTTMSENAAFSLNRIFALIDTRRRKTTRVKKKRLELSFRMVKLRAKNIYSTKSYPRLSARLLGFDRFFRV